MALDKLAIIRYLTIAYILSTAQMNVKKGAVMATVSIVYHSGFGSTAKVAERIAKGAGSIKGTTIQTWQITGAQITDGHWQDDAVIEALSASDAIIFGAPTYMGMVSGPFKCFADATAPLWIQMSWKDKLAGGFTTSSHPSGDKVMSLHYMATLAAQLRMVWVGPAEPASHIVGDDQGIDRWGYYLGVGTLGSIRSTDGVPDDGDLKTAEKYGERIALLTRRWLGYTLPTDEVPKLYAA